MQLELAALAVADQRRAPEFVGEPRDEAYGTVVVFRDVAGNKWDLLGPRPS